MLDSSESLQRVSPDIFETQKVLDQLDPTLPEVFKEDARQVAKYIELLDNGQGFEDPNIRNFITQLIESSFVLEAMDNEATPKLPSWLQMDFLLANKFREPFKNPDEVIEDEVYIKMFYDWVAEEGWEHDGPYYYVDPLRRQACALPQRNKAYIEYDELLAAHKSHKLSQLVKGLAYANYPLSITKSNGNSLVLYFNHDIADFDRADTIFKQLGIKYRGPAQDVYIISTDDQGELRVSVSESNDTALSTGGRLKDKEYSPSGFLRDYLNLCSNRGKSPVLPYQTSFVRMYSYEDFDASQKLELVKKASELAGYPVHYRDVVSGDTRLIPVAV